MATINYRYDFGIENAEPIFEQFISEHGFFHKRTRGPDQRERTGGRRYFSYGQCPVARKCGQLVAPDTVRFYCSRNREVLLAWVRDGEIVVDRYRAHAHGRFLTAL